MTRVLVVDDQAVVRSGLRMIVEAQGDLEVVGEASDGREALRLARELDPDVVLMDIRMPNLDGIEATRRLVNISPSTRVLVLTTYGIDEHVYEALKAGAAGFFVKTDSPERLVAGIRSVSEGDTLLGPETTRRLVEHFTSGPSPHVPVSPKLADLTPREREVLILVARGNSNAEIARHLHLSEGTVKTHVARVLAKLGLRDRVQAVVFAYESGTVTRGLRDSG